MFQLKIILFLFVIISIVSCKTEDTRLADMETIATIDGASAEYRVEKKRTEFDSIVTYIGFRDYPYIKDSFKLRLFFWDTHIRGYLNPKLRNQNVQFFGKLENNEIYLKANPKLGDREIGGGFSIKPNGSRFDATYYQLEENKFTPIKLKRTKQDFDSIFK